MKLKSAETPCYSIIYDSHVPNRLGTYHFYVCHANADNVDTVRGTNLL